VRLHPRVFREQFGEEMMWIFEEAAETHGAVRLLSDGMVRSRASGFPSEVLGGPGDRRRCFHIARAVVVCLEHISASPSRLSARRWLQGGMVSLALFAGAWLAVTQSISRLPIKSFGTDSDSTRSARGLAPSVVKDAGSGSTMGGAYEYRVYAGVTPRDLREAQRRQQQLAVQVASGARAVPGATIFVVESQGVVPEVPKTPAGKQFRRGCSLSIAGSGRGLKRCGNFFKDPRDQS